MNARTRAWVMLATLAAGWSTSCGDFREPGDLRHARILAVRMDKPRLAPGDKARLDLLVTSDDGVPSVAVPGELTLAPPLPGQPAPPDIARALISHEGVDWFVSAPDETLLAQARMALGMSSDAVLLLPLQVAFVLGGEKKLADKIAFLGKAGGNPVIGVVTVSGQPFDEGAQIVVSGADAKEVVLQAAADGDGALTYAWFTGFGKLLRYREARATLKVEKPEDPRQGAVVVIVRDAKGGVAWRTGALRLM